MEVTRASREETWSLYERMRREMKVSSAKDLPYAFKNLDLCLTHAVYLEAIREYIDRGRKSRGHISCSTVMVKSPVRDLAKNGGFPWRKRKTSSIKKSWVKPRPIQSRELV